jgi:7,8-dihydropterin-6-yl-methyl-4-(beta-D-ribofuranosyl)aminobenzene 5'-phosphate synthase
MIPPQPSGGGMQELRSLLARAAALWLTSWAAVGLAAEAPQRVAALKITTLSTMLADEGIGEWGYAALVEADGKRILFDTGARPRTVLDNARELGIDLSSVEDVVLSHNHGDHTGGLVTLRRELATSNPRALARAHVGEGIFARRVSPSGVDSNGLLPEKAAYEASGARFVVHGKAVEIAPGVWLTGPVPRIHPEKSYASGLTLELPTGTAPDTIPEDGSLVIATAQGLVVLTGCGHAGIVNIVEHARKLVPSAPLLAVIGGLHTFDASDELLAWTGKELKAAGIRYLLAAHCTGIEATFRLRQELGLERRTAVVAAVGSSFTLGKGIDPLDLAR